MLMNVQLIFAHAGETHETVTAATSHSLFSRWYVALPLYILLLIVITKLAFVLSHKSKPVTYNVLLVTLFVAGVATYTLSAPISVLSLGVGFAMALFQVLIGLSGFSDEA